MAYLKIIMDGDNRWLGLRVCLDVSEVLGWGPSFSGVQKFYSVDRDALGRSHHSDGCSEAVGETPARSKTHPNAQCFLLQMLGVLFNLVISHRNTNY